MTVTDANGCTIADTIVVTNTPCSGIVNVNKGDSDFQVYPNPASNELILNYKNAVSFFIYNLLGQMEEEIILEKNTSTKNISITNIPSGIYFCVLKTEDGKMVQQKLVVQK